MSVRRTRRHARALTAAAGICLAACGAPAKPILLHYATGRPQPLVGIPLGHNAYGVALPGTLIPAIPDYTRLDCVTARAGLPQRAATLWQNMQYAMTMYPTSAFINDTYLPQATIQGKAALLGPGAPSLRALVAEVYDTVVHGGATIPCQYLTLSGALSIATYALATGTAAPGSSAGTASRVSQYVAGHLPALPGTTMQATVRKSSYGLEVIQVTEQTPEGTFNGNDYAAQYGGHWFLVFVGAPL